MVGANGAGKTTLLKMICGLIVAEKGSISLRQRKITELSISERIKSGLGYLSQSSSLIQSLSVEDNLYLIPALQKDDLFYREALLHQFNLDGDIRYQRVDTLSGGEARKLEFCCCMATRPIYILLDEPFSGLDPKTTQLIVKMNQSQHQKGVSFIISDHRIEELKKIASYYALLHNGKVAYSGEAQGFFTSQEVRTLFLGEG